MALKEVMDRNDIKGQDFAREVGVQPETVSRWRSGEMVPGGERLQRCLSVLRRHDPAVTLDDILGAPEPVEGRP